MRGSLNRAVSTRLAEVAVNSSDDLSLVNSLFIHIRERMYHTVKVIWTSEVVTMASCCDGFLTYENSQLQINVLFNLQSKKYIKFFFTSFFFAQKFEDI